MLPTPYLLTVRTVTAGAEDEFGNPTPVTADHSWPVHAIAPGAMDEPGAPNRDASLVLWTVYAPKSSDQPSASSLVRLPGQTEWLAVDGEPKDWTLGPWSNPIAGLVVELRRADG